MLAIIYRWVYRAYLRALFRIYTWGNEAEHALKQELGYYGIANLSQDGRMDEADKAIEAAEQRERSMGFPNAGPWAEQARVYNRFARFKRARNLP